jgi:hypothetical protein
MAYYAFLDKNSIVTEVIAGKNEGEDGIDWEVWYGDFKNQICKRTSYNTHGGMHYGQNGEPDGGIAFRKNYAGPGYFYDNVLDAFIPPKPYPSWLLNTATCQWQAPIPYPTDGKQYYWDEATQSWVEVTP